jgi:hypothetical protein
MYLVVIWKSPNNRLRTAAWLEAGAKAQEEIYAAKRDIQDRARIHQRRREIQLLRQQDAPTPASERDGVIEFGKQ